MLPIYIRLRHAIPIHAMRSTDGNRKSVGSIIRVRRRRKIQELCHHIYDLFFRRLPIARHRLLYLQWRSLHNWYIILSCSKEHDTTCLSDRNRCCHVPIKEKLLHPHRIGRIFLDEHLKLRIDFQKALLNRHFRWCCNRAIGMRTQT